MDKELILENIINNYNIETNLSLIKLSQFKQYPHIFKLECPNFSLIIKIVDNFRIHCKDINQLYFELSKINCIAIPILTKNKSYFSVFGNRVLLLYEELSEIINNPNSIWWSECLGNIHNIKVNANYEKCFSTNFYNQTTNLLKEAQRFIAPTLMSKIVSLITEVDIERINKIKKMVLCHNDPYNLNVMTKSFEYKLIDTDGMGLSPREYDIQRLIYNHLINSNDLDDSLLFWNSFKNKYEIKADDKINVPLLKDIYILDLIKTMSWLYISCNDLSRKDRERQQKQLYLFEKSFDNDAHYKILKKL